MSPVAFASGQLDAFLAAAASTGRPGLPAFPTDLPEPLHFASYELTRSESALLARRVQRAGFAVVDVTEEPTEQNLTALAARLGLGDPFVPPIYRRPGAVTVASSGVSTLTATADGVAHPAVSANGQGLHVDGLLQPIGTVRTSVLLCARPAAQGGVSTLFNSTAAFWALVGEDPQAAETLMGSGVLTRTASVNGSTDQATGPAFAVVDGQLLTRYSRDGNDTWTPAPGQDAALDRALEAMDAMAQPGSPYAAELTLAAGQGLVFANSRLCHGRTVYLDDPAAPRRMLRGLFTRDTAA
ncbi:TauD/TfdA family dioxygenase [Kitasatospora sp. NPDC127060]|uniref:TauD/TfdA family dioxygenase n=1 Tax=Kitasatospora sp. NPDC127060 TaxID=3347121 RepID=UPI00365D3708